MTDKELFAKVRALGLRITKRDGEYRVAFPGGREASAYYTNDKDDALGTAHLMKLEMRESNPGRRSIHSAKWDRCVKDVKRKGTAVDPYAVCTAALGELSFRAGSRRTRNPCAGIHFHDVKELRESNPKPRRGPWPRGKVPPQLRPFLFKSKRRARR
jgi:hypothetical protein